MSGLGCCTSAMDSDDEWDNDYQFGGDYVNDQVSPPGVQDSSLPPPRNSAEVPLPDIPQDSRQSYDFQNFLDGEEATDGMGGIAAGRNSQTRERFTLGDIKQRFRASGHGRKSTSGQAPTAQELPNYENVPRQGMQMAEARQSLQMAEAPQSLPMAEAPQGLFMEEAPQSLPVTEAPQGLPSYENVPRQFAPTKDRKSKKKTVQISAPPDKPVDVSGVPLVPPIPAYPASTSQAPGSTSADPSALRSVSYSVPVATTVSPTPTPTAAPPVVSNAFAASNGLPPLAPVIPAYPPAPTPAPAATSSSNTRNVVIPAIAAVTPVAPQPAPVVPPAASNPHAPFVPAYSTAPGPLSYSVPVVTSPSQTPAQTAGTPSITAPLVSETMTSYAPPQPVAAPPPPPPPPVAPAPPPPPVVPAPAPAPPPPPAPAPPVQLHTPVPAPQPPPPQFEPPRPAPPPVAPPAPAPAPARVPPQQNNYRGPFTETIDLQLPTDQHATFPRDNLIRGRQLDDEGWSTVSRIKVG